MIKMKKLLMEGFNYNRKFGEPLPTLEDFAKKKQVKENIYREQASDVSKIMRKMKITKVKEDGSRSWKSASENIWYKYDLKDNQEFAYSIKPTMSYIYLYQKDADRRKTDKKLKEIAKELKKIGYLAHPSRSAAGYMEYVGPYFQGKR